MISNIVYRALYSSNDSLDILWTPAESVYFQQFLSHIFNPCRFINMDNTYYGNVDIGLVICNNRLLYFDKCVNWCKQFHSPLLIIDHDIKSRLINDSVITNTEFEPVIQIALSDDIYISWDKIHDAILDVNASPSNIKKWKEAILYLLKSNFILKEDTNAKIAV